MTPAVWPPFVPPVVPPVVPLAAICPMVLPMTQPPAAPPQAAIAKEILRQAVARGPDKSLCPSEVARALAGAGDDDPWRPLMGSVREAALRLAAEGRIEILRKGKPVPPEGVRGVIRLRVAGP